MRKMPDAVLGREGERVGRWRKEEKRTGKMKGGGLNLKLGFVPA